MSEATQNRWRGTRHLGLIFFVAAVAAVAAAITVAVSLKVWAMFIGWTCFGTAMGNSKRGVLAIICLLIGILLGMFAIVALPILEAKMGVMTLPLVVFLLVVIVMLAQAMSPFDSVPGYFLGMTAIFASGSSPSIAAFVELGGAAVIGAVAGWLLIVLPGYAPSRTRDLS